jgi:hypothetical protein
MYINAWLFLGVGDKVSSEMLDRGVFYRNHKKFDAVLSNFFTIERIDYFRREIIFDWWGLNRLIDLFNFFILNKKEHKNKKNTRRTFATLFFLNLYTKYYRTFVNRSFLLLK